MDNISYILKSFSMSNAVCSLREQYEQLLRSVKVDGVYVFGTGQLGNFCVNQIKKNGYLFKGFIDNDSIKQDGVNVYSPDVIKPDDAVIIGSIHYYDISNQLINQGCLNHIYYETLALMDDDFDIYYDGFKGWFEDIERNKDEYISIKELLADDVSRSVFDDVIMYRMNLDPNYLHSAKTISLLEGEQDFDNVVTKRFGSSTVFIDAGGYDGYTTKRFIDICPCYSKIYYFEPDKRMMDISLKNLAGVKNIEFLNYGVGETVREAKFDFRGNGGSTICNSGNETVRIVKLDDYISSKNCYVKMDIEGVEYNAIIGMRNSIKLYLPILGISVYHLPGDMIRIIKEILRIEPNYKVYLRHYTDSYADTIAYFVA